MGSLSADDATGDLLLAAAHMLDLVTLVTLAGFRCEKWARRTPIVLVTGVSGFRMTARRRRAAAGLVALDDRPASDRRNQNRGTGRAV